MRRWKRVVFFCASTFAVVLLAVIGVGVWIAQSQWLREKVRENIVGQAEQATGGKVELGAFSFDWRTLTAEVDRFVIHGTEPAGQSPLLAIDRVRARLRVISMIRRDISIDQIEAVHPQVHLIVTPDGKTNLPRPKLRQPARSVTETILDLKIAKFDLRNGWIVEESSGQPARAIPVNAQGENLGLHVTYDLAGPRYSGDLSLAPVRIAWNGAAPVNLQVSASGWMEQNRILLTRARVATKDSSVDLRNVVLRNFTAPVTTAQYDAHVSLTEATQIFRLRTRQNGMLDSAGNARFVSATDYRITGSLRGAGIDFDRLRNLRIVASLDAGPDKVALSSVRAGVLGGQITATAEIRDFDKFRATGTLEHFDLRQVAALDTKQTLPWDALVSGPFEASGRLRDMRRDNVTVGAHLNLSPVAGAGAPVRGDIAFTYDAAKGKLDLDQSWLELPHTRVDVSGIPGERLNVKLGSGDIKDLLPALDIVTDSKTPALAFKSLSFGGVVTGPLTNPQISGHATAEDADYQGHRVESFAGDVTASRSNVAVRNGAVVYNNIHARGDGSIALADWRASDGSTVAARIEVANADLTRILAMAGHKEVEISGTLSASSQIGGTLGEPRGGADLTLSKGFIYAQPFDSVSGRAEMTGKNAQSLTGLFVSGPKRVNIIARFEHAGTQFPAGRLEFNLTSNTMPLNQIALVRQRQPDIHGFGKFHADGSVQIGHDAKHEIQFNLLGLNADASANSLELGGRNLGDARFTAQTKNDVMTARFDSDAAKATIHGEGSMQLVGDYPVDARLTFANAGLNSLAALIVKEDDAGNLNFDGTAEGEVTISGPAKKPDLLTAALNVPRVEIRPLPGSDLARNLPNFVLTNNGPVRVTLAKSLLRVESARFKAPQTDLTVEGTVALAQQSPLDLRVRGDVNLALASTFNPDLTSSGTVSLNATVRGGWKTPDLSGRAAIRNGDFHYTDFSNGLTSANGEIVFNGARATIQSFTAESGGGKVDATGFAALTNGALAFRIEAKARAVRVRYPEGVSSISDAALTFAGTSQRSEASGLITVHRVAINPKSDAATILQNAVSPVKTPSVKTGLVANVNLDVQIETAPDVALETSVTQSIQADANLRLRGTATSPALLGRINITQGDLIFFGNKYSITQGSISFFNPARIDPILNIDLETKARGVDVILTVSGPVNKLNVNYRSDPPLQFSDIVALLATGRTPTDPTLAVRDTGQSQGFQQLGASALIGQAIANPVAGRLQRFFGVSRLKIDPQLTGITGSPEARLTIEQQVTPDILFTYITDVSSTSTQLIRVEWSFNRHWSAILIREENGYVGMDFAYKKRFK